MTMNNGIRFEAGVLMACILLLTGCDNVRVVTYPENYTYIDRGKVTSTMGKLAVRIDRLDRALRNASPQQDEVLRELDAMEEIAGSLGVGREHTNHLMLDEHLDTFRSDLRAARRAAQESPPNYYPAGKLAGSCNGCHASRSDYQ